MPKLECVPQLGAVLILLLSCQGGGAQEYQVDLTRENQVSFLSDAPLEDFEGVTDRVDGFVFLEGEGLVGGTDLAVSEFFFEVDLASLDTGLGLRNRHMRENYLETDKYPLTTYAATVEAVRSAGNGGLLITARGTMNLHGVERELDLGCEVTSNHELYRASCSFEVLLSDYDIKIPSLMFMKISDAISIELVFFLSRAESGL